ncbi:MAG: hypothetical protein OXO50_20860 [Caldilineaceae bacterium]|nr:hypothetical protein [Caldilineaceae bacterium]
MAKRRHTPGQVINKHGEAAAAISEGGTALWASGRRRRWDRPGRRTDGDGGAE